MADQFGMDDAIVKPNAAEDFGANDDVDQHNPLRRGWNKMTQSVGLTSDLATGDYKGAASRLSEINDYQKKNPGTPEGKKLMDAWSKGDGIAGGISEVGGAIAKDWNESDGALAKLRAVGRNVSAMGQGVLEQTPNMVLPMVGMLAGGAAGSVASPVVGTALGGWAGASLGNTAVEGGGMAQEAIQKAQIDLGDKAATEEYLKKNGDTLLTQAGIKGAIIGAVDTATAGIGHHLLAGPAKAAASRAATELGIDVADKAAMKAAASEIASRMAVDPVYMAAKSGGQNIARNAGAAALEPTGEFAGEYIGQGVANDEWDTKNAFLEAASSIGQGAATFAGQKAFASMSNPFGSGDKIAPPPVVPPAGADVPPTDPTQGIAPETVATPDIKLGNSDVLTGGELYNPGDTTDPINGNRIPAKPSEAMGIKADAGPLSRVAAGAVDGGMYDEIQQAQATEQDQAAYDAYMAQQEADAQQQDTANQAITQGPLAEAQMSEDDKRAVLFSNKAVADGGTRYKGTRDGDILNGAGAPFTNYLSAGRRASMEGKDWTIAKIGEKQFVARRKDANGPSAGVSTVSAGADQGGVAEPAVAPINSAKNQAGLGAVRQTIPRGQQTVQPERDIQAVQPLQPDPTPRPEVGHDQSSAGKRVSAFDKSQTSFANDTSTSQNVKNNTPAASAPQEAEQHEPVSSGRRVTYFQPPTEKHKKGIRYSGTVTNQGGKQVVVLDKGSPSFAGGQREIPYREKGGWESATSSEQKQPLAPANIAPQAIESVANEQNAAPGTEATPDAQAQAVGANTDAAEPTAGAGSAQVEADGVKAGDWVKPTVGNDTRPRQVDSVGSDGWVYTKSGDSFKPGQFEPTAQPVSTPITGGTGVAGNWEPPASQAPTKPAPGPASLGSVKADMDHLFGVDAKRTKALDRIAKGTAYFGNPMKAGEFITKNGLKDTHKATKTSATRWDIVAKQEAPVDPADAAQAAIEPIATTQGKDNGTQTTKAQPSKAQQPAKAKKGVGVAEAATIRARANYFTPGNVVASYGGFDEVLSYDAGENGRWSATVHEVKKVDGQWIRQGRPQDARQHSTEPSSQQLKDGPVVVMESQPANAVVYSESRRDGQPHSNSVARGAPVSNMQTVDDELLSQEAIDRIKKNLNDPAKTEQVMGDIQKQVDAATPVQREPTEHAGLKIYPFNVKVGDKVEQKWGVQTLNNSEREKKGERQLGGDPLADTLEGAKKLAEQEVEGAKRIEAYRAEMAALDDKKKEADAVAQAKKDANKGKSIAERRKDSILDGPTKLHPNAGLGTGTKREAMQKAVEQDRYIQSAMVRDEAAKKRDQESTERARRNNLPTGNINYPGVKEYFEAVARLKADDYTKPEYRVYDGRDTKGAFREISKTEYDYAQELKTKPPVAPVDIAPVATETVAKPDAKAALSEREKAAKAKMLGALGKLATLASKNTRMNWTQEEEQALLPIVIELFDGAMELGYVTFQQAVQHVREFIANGIDQETADAIPFETLQGAYIAVAGRHKDKPVTSKKEVVGFDSLAELANSTDSADTPAKETQNATLKLDSTSPSPLEGVSTEQVSGTGEVAPTGESADRSGRGDPAGNGSSDSAGVQVSGGVGSDTGAVPVPARGKRSKRGSTGQSGVQGDAGIQPGLGFVDTAGGTGGLIPANPAPNAAPIPAPAFADFTIEDDFALGEGGQKAKFKGNIEAIRLLAQLDAEGRMATPTEQAVLAKYVGWGGLAQAFDENNADWSKEYAELKGLMSADDYADARVSTRYAHFTSRQVVQDGIYAALAHFGFNGGRALEGGAGVGNFIGLMPAAMRSASRFTAIEREPFSAKIARNLYPQQNVQEADFTEFVGNDDFYDVAVGNPPFASDPQVDRSGRKHLSGLSLHNYFFAKEVDMLREGGILAQVITNSFMDATTDTARKYIAEKTKLLGAIRLPNNAFSKNANTEVTTDLIFLQKLPESEWGGKAARANAKEWLSVGQITDTEGRTVALNQYFIDHPDMMLGKFGAYGTMYRGESPALVQKPGQDTAALLKEAVSKLPANVYVDRAITNTASLQDALIKTLQNPQVQEGGYFEEDGKLFQRIKDIAGEARAQEVTAQSQWTEKTKLGDNGFNRIKSLAGMRSTVRSLLAAELANDANMEALRKTLNDQYDAYSKDHGRINDPGTIRVFGDDPDFPLLASLEYGYTPAIGLAAAKSMGIKMVPSTATKGPIFTRRVIDARQQVAKVESPSDALNVSMAERGKLDTKYIGELLGKDADEALHELSGGDSPLLFNDPATGEYVLRDAYLSGNVRAKLVQAKQAGMFNNIKALEAVQPEDVGAHEINARIGSPWVPESVYQDFAKSLLGEGTDASIKYVKASGGYSSYIHAGSETANTNTWGTPDYRGSDMLSALLNNKPIKVTYKDAEGKIHIDVIGTENANAKAQEMRDKFQDWLFADADRAELLGRAYNDTNNNYVTRQYDGAWMTFPGKVPNAIVEFRRHQRNAIARIVQDRTALLDHVVGSGKTYTVIASAMELRRTGLAKKPMIAVPNHLVKQWAADFYKLYPGANILTATKKDFEKSNRRKFLAKIATGDWDAVIIAHSSYGFIRPAPDFEAAFNTKQVENIVKTIREVDNGDGEKQQKKRTIKQLEGIKERLENRIKALRDKPMDALLDFGELGVDQLFVDEAHMFKNLMFSTKMQNIAGLGDSKGSQRAYDMYVKANQLFERNGRGQGVVFATGTPVSNSLAEMYHMMRYLMPKQMEEMGFESFDAWANTYASVEQVWMQKASADGFKAQNRMSNFVNTPELLKVFDQVSDTVTMEDVKKAFSEENQGREFPLPKLKGGKRTPMSLRKSPAQESYMADIANRALALEKRKGPPQKGEDNILVIMSDARKAAMDVRLVDPTITVREAGGRIDRASQELFARYTQYNDVKGTQLVFSDLGTPLKTAKKELAEYQALKDRIEAGYGDELVGRAALGDEAAQAKIDDAEDAQEELEAKGRDWLGAMQAAERGFSVYDDLKAALIEKGIPEGEIAFIHDYNTDEQKAGLFRKVNSGQIRVLLGSTQKLGAGTNVQERLVALHHLDVPWKPSDVEQREGRIIRQGNTLSPVEGRAGGLPDFEVEILAYVTQDTLDMRMWQVQETKLKMINQLRTRKIGRDIENAFEDLELSAGEMQAAATGNIDLLREIQIKGEIKKLEQRKRAFDAQKSDLQSRKKSVSQKLESLPAKIESSKGMAEASDQYRTELAAIANDFKATIDGKDYTDPKEAGAVLLAMIDNKVYMQRQADGKYGGRQLTEAQVAEEPEQDKKAADYNPWVARPVPLSVNMNGEVFTSRDKLTEAFSNLRGDKDPIAWTLDGTTFNRRTQIEGAIRQAVADSIAEEQVKDVGQLGPFTVSVEGQSGRFEKVLDVVLTYKGQTISNARGLGAPDATTAERTVPVVVRMAENLAVSARQQHEYEKRQLEQAKKEKAELDSAPVSGEWPDQPKLEELRKKHQEVLKSLSSAGLATTADGETLEGAMGAIPDTTANTTDVAFSRPTFSRGAQSQANESVERLATGIASHWENAPKVVVAFDMNDPIIPENVRKEDQRQRSGGATGTPEGFYYKGTVYLMSSKLGTPNDIARVLFHEALGHYGLRGTFGKALRPILRDVAMLRRAEVDAKIKQYGLKMGNTLDRFTAAEEVLAELAQTKPEIGFVQRAIAAIRTWLRQNVPGFASLRLSNAELIRNYILPARQFVEQGGGPKGGVRVEPTFSRGKDGKSSVLSKHGFFNAWPKFNSWTRAEYNDVVSLLPQEYRSDAHRAEPLSPKDRDARTAAALPEIKELNSGIGGAKGFGVDGLGNIVADMRDGVSTRDLIKAADIADKHGLGVFVTGVRTGSMPGLMDAGFVSEMGLGGVLARVTKSSAPVMPMASGVVNNTAYGTMMAYKPRGFAAPMFSRGTNDPMTNNDVVGNQGGRSADDISPGVQSRMVAAYNEELKRDGNDVPPGYWYREVTQRDVENTYGDIEDVPANIREALTRGEDVVEWGSNSDGGLWTKSEAPTEQEFYDDARRDEGWPGPIKTIDQIFGTPNLNEAAASRAFEALAESEGWSVGNGVRYLEISKPNTEKAAIEEGYNTIRVNVRISNHSRTANATRPTNAKNIDINLAPQFGRGNEFHHADTWESAVEKMRNARVNRDGDLKFDKNRNATKVNAVGANSKPETGSGANTGGVDRSIPNESIDTIPGAGIKKPMTVNPTTLVFRESEQNRKDELTSDTDEFDPIVVIDKDGELSILDGHNRASVAIDRGDSLKAVKVTKDEYDRLQEKGFEDGEIAWAALQRADQSHAAGNLDSQFPGSEISKGGDKAWDDLIENESTAPDSGGAMFSRSLGDTLASATNSVRDVAASTGMGRIANKAVDVLNERMSHEGTIGLWHKTFGSMYQLAKSHPPFKRVFDAAQNFINDVSYYASESADLAPKLLPKLEDWRDLTKTAISPEDNKAIEAPIFEGTLSWARDESGKPVKVDVLIEAAEDLTVEQKAQRLLRNKHITEQVLKMWQGMRIEDYEKNIDAKFERDMLRAGVVWKESELKSMFNLTGEKQSDGTWTGQIGLYKEFRNAIDSSLDNTAKAEMLRFAGKDAAPLREIVLDAPDADTAAVLLRDHLLALAEDDPARSAALTDTANGVMDRADKVKQLKKEGYAPLSRFGQYSVDVVVEGEREYFGLFETKHAANQMAAKMRIAYGDENVSTGTMSDKEFQLFQGITPESMELFGNMLGLDATGDKSSDAVFQEYLKRTKNNRSAMKRLIRRKGIAGFSTDTGRVLASFIYSNARMTSAGLHMGELDSAVQDIPKGQGQLKDAAIELREYIKNPREEAQAMRGLLFAQYLGGNVASMLMNFMQVPTVSLPYLSQFGGVTKATGALVKAMKDQKSNMLEKGLQQALKAADEKGITQPQSVHELMAQSRGSATLKSGDGTRTGNALAHASNNLSKFSVGWGKLFGMAEQINRRSTFIAAYRLGVEHGVPDPAAFAEKAVNETQFINNKANKAKFARGAIGGTLMTFKSYSTNYLELLYRLSTQNGPEGKKAALLMLGMLFLMAGAGGMPGAEDAEDLIDGIGQRMGYNLSTKKAKEEFLENTFGKPMAQFIMSGVSGLPGSPIDVSGRAGLGDLIPGTGVFMPKASHANDLLEFGGPAAGMLKRFGEAAGHLSSGNVFEAAMSASPVAVANARKGIDMAVSGMYKDAKGYKVMDTSPSEAVAKFAGFQPKSVKSDSDDSYMRLRSKNFYNEYKQSVTARWANGMFESDPDQVQEAKDMIASWNEKNPELPMRPNMMAVAQRLKKMRETREERILKGAPKAMQATIRKEIAEDRAAQ